VLAVVRSPDDLEAREYAYEALGASVFGQSGSWYLLAVGRDSARVLGWISARHTGAFHSLEELLRNGLAYLTADWDERLYTTPGGPPIAHRPAGSGNRDINVTQTHMSGGILWLEVELLTPGRCSSRTEPGVTARGWTPAHSPTGQPNAWFHSRGC